MERQATVSFSAEVTTHDRVIPVGPTWLDGERVLRLQLNSSNPDVFPPV